MAMRLVAAVAAVMVAVPAMAQGGAVRSAHDAIVRGDVASAERLLVAERQIYPSSSEVLINLAAVYAATGRQAQAAALYRNVLGSTDVLLDRGDATTVSSHAIARTGLTRIAGVQTAAR